MQNTQQEKIHMLYNLKPYLVIFFIYYLFVSFTGYGNDDDIYRILSSGQDLILNHVYHPSRFQGYLIPEIIIGATSLIGGHYFSNFISIILGVSVLYLFHYFLRKVFDRQTSLILTLIVGFNPYFVIAATSSLDYIYGLFFLLLGTLLLYKKSYLLSIPVFALSLSSRMANAFLVGFVFLYFLIITYPADKKEFAKIFMTGFVALLLTLSLYIPVYIASDHTFRFFGYYIQGYDWTGYVTRFIYKNIALISLPSTLFLYGMIAYNLVKKKIQMKQSTLLLIVVSAIIVEQLKFLKIPIQLSFLLPTFMLMVALYPYFLKTKTSLYLMLALTIFYNVVNIDFLKFTYVPDKGATDGTTLVADGAEVGLFINPGIIVQDIKDRETSRKTYFKEMGLPITKH